MLSILTIPTASTTDMLAATGVLFSDLWLITAFAAGVPLAFYIIRRVIALVPKGR